MKKNKKPQTNKSLSVGIFNAFIHLGFIYLAYSISSRYVYDNNITFVVDRTNSVSADGNLIIFWSIFAAAVLSYLLTGLVWFLVHKKPRMFVSMSVKNFIFANIIPSIAIVTAAYLTFDQLVGIIIYTLFIVVLIYFRDY